jgi:transcriptional regulator with XRE-family HTH domain
MSPGQLLKEARRRHGVSQRSLARRASTTQSAISRVERDRISPSIETMSQLLALLGESLVISSETEESGIDLTLNRANLELTPAQRVERGLGFANLVRENRGGPRGGER